MITTDLRRSLLVAAMFAVLLPTSAARAQDGGRDEAEALFQRARELMGESHFDQACPMLERSYALDHGAGTLLALALCHEGSGKLATALREYRESLSLAVKANRSDRVMLAESHVQKLEAAVPRLALRFASTPPPGLGLTLDGAGVDRATMSMGAPVDPGKHDLVASSPTTPTWRATVNVTVGAGTVMVDVPALVPPAPAPQRLPPSSPSRIPGWLAVGVGVAGTAVGAVFGVAAFGAESRSKKECTGNQCPLDGVNLNHQARLDATVSDVAFAAGGTALAVGIYLLLRSSSSSATAAWLRPSSGPGQAGIGVAASW
jgi:hypothetical protein